MKQYNSPLLVMGADAWGSQVLKVIEGVGYGEHIYTTENKKKKIGYIENEANRQRDLQEFAYAVRDGLIVEYRPAVEEMFGWNVDNGKYISSMPNDDLVIAGAKANVAARMVGDGGDVDVESFA